MKKLIVLLALSVFVLSCQSTKKTTTTVDKNSYENAYDDFLEPNETKVYSWYLGLHSVRDKEAYIVRIFYPEKKQITSLQTYKYDDREVLHGKYISWTDNGLKTKEGNYENDFREGTWKYYSAGKLRSEGKYVNGKVEGLWKHYYKNGKIERKVNWENDLREGDFVEYDSLGTVIKEGVYQADTILEQTRIVEKRVANRGSTYTIVEQMPRFPGCEEEAGDNKTKKKCADRKLMEFIYENIKYPSYAREQGAEGIVMIQFTITKDGSVADVHTLRGICEPFEKECLRIVNMMPQWIAGRQNGKAVRVRMNMPVRFKLN